jgi:NDP-sugar pyrophosphorylase family protein
MQLSKEKNNSKKPVISLVYMVAGLSSRFGGRVKQFAIVGKNNETLIEVSLNQALSAGFGKIIFIVGDKTEKLFKEKFGDSYKGIPVFYAKQEYNPDERDKPWGTCDAVVAAKDLIKEDFVVCNGDDLYGKNTFKILFDYLAEKNSSATIGFELGKVVPREGFVNRAIYSFDSENNVLDLKEIIGVEEKKFSELGLTKKTLCSMNIFALKKEIINLLEQRLNEFKKTNEKNRKIECYLPVEISGLIKKNELSLKLLPTPDDWMGITNPDDEPVLKKILAQEKY